MQNKCIQNFKLFIILLAGLLVATSVMSSQSALWISEKKTYFKVAQSRGVDTPAISEQSTETVQAPDELSGILPVGLAIDVRECTAALNAISCDINIRSDLNTSATLSLHGVYWKTKFNGYKKTAILSKNIDKLSTEITVVPGADIFVSSLMIVNISDQRTQDLSLGIHLSIGTKAYFVNTMAVGVVEITG